MLALVANSRLRALPALSPTLAVPSSHTAGSLLSERRVAETRPTGATLLANSAHFKVTLRMDAIRSPLPEDCNLAPD